MSLDLKTYLNKIKNTLFRKNSFLSMNPYNNWLLVNIIFIILNIVILTNGALGFYKISSDEIILSKSNSEVSSGTINRALLEEVLMNFGVESENYSDLKLNKPVLVDPSI